MNEEISAHDINVRWLEIFAPNTLEKQRFVRESATRFVYYTTADTAARIIKNKEIWMRNVTTMNDYMEAQYGLRCLQKAYNGEQGRQLRLLLAPYFSDLLGRLEQIFNQWIPHFLMDTYIACVSEHLPSEDRTGRLSMWRAYGNGSGVALVLNNSAFLSETDALRAYSVPVSYMRDDAFVVEFRDMTQRLSENLVFVRGQGEEALLNWIFSTMRYSVVAVKHDGFREEREWRVVHSPRYEPSRRLAYSVETIKGTPQRVYKIPLQNIPDEGLVGVEIPELIDRVIIGPTNYAHATGDALAVLLEAAGVKDAERKIVISDIPLRVP